MSSHDNRDKCEGKPRAVVCNLRSTSHMWLFEHLKYG